MNSLLKSLLVFVLLAAAGFAEDTPRVAEWRKKAEAGDAKFQAMIGECYADGDRDNGISVDYAEAVKWYRKAADQGLAKAQFNLGVMYDSGNGVPKDDAKAVEWYRKAADQGLAKAQSELGLLKNYNKSGAIPENIPEGFPSMEVTGHRGGTHWFENYMSARAPIMAEQGDPTSCIILAWMYKLGYKLPQNSTEAVKWYRKAAEIRDSPITQMEAEFMLGLMYDTGDGVPKDGAKAVEWYRKAADKQTHFDIEPAALYHLGHIYYFGKGIPKDLVQAHFWWTKSSNHYNEYAAKNLVFIEKEMTSEQIVEAIKLEAKEGFYQAKVNLANRYLTGEGVPKDFVQAHALFSSVRDVNKNYSSAKELPIIEEQMTLEQINEAMKLANELWEKRRRGSRNPYASFDSRATDYDKKKRDAMNGDVDAQFWLGLMYNNGRDDTPKYYTEAIKWWRKAAEQGHARASYWVGVMYEVGRGVPKDDAEADKWYCLAVQRGYNGTQEGREHYEWLRELKKLPIYPNTRYELFQRHRCANCAR